MKRSKISQFEIVKPPALRGLAKRQGWPNTCRFQSGFAIFFFCVESLPSGALVHLAVFSPSAALAGRSWLINRSLPIFRLRLASSSPTLGAPRHRERARACRRTIHCLQCEPLPCTRSCRLPRRPSRRTSSLARTTRDRVCDMKSKQSAPLQLSVGDHGGR